MTERESDSRARNVFVNSAAPAAWKIIDLLLGMLLAVGAWIYTGHVAETNSRFAAIEHNDTIITSQAHATELKLAQVETEGRNNSARLERIETKLDELRELILESRQEVRTRYRQEQGNK